MPGSGSVLPTEQYFDKGLWGWDGTQWRKLPLLWGFTGTVGGTVTWTSDGTTPYHLSGTAVPAGEVWTLNTVRVLHSDPVARATWLYAVVGGGAPVIDGNQTLAQWSFVANVAPLVLGPGEYPRVTIYSLAVGQTVYLHWAGYKMAVT